MSMRYKGSVISATPPVLATDAGASGAWTLEQQMQAKAAGKWPKNGPFNWIEDVFSTYTYTGNGATQTITNGIDLAGKGGLVWFKPRNTANNHNLIDSVRGINKFLITNDTSGQGTTGAGFGVASFNSNGFSLDPPWTSSTNTTDTTQVAWTFREQPKFFDVVTYTGTGVQRTVPHNLGSVPGCVIVKSSTYPLGWPVYHRSNGTSAEQYLNTTDAVSYGDKFPAAPTSTEFTISGNGYVNEPGQTYVAYLFAHNAGGFGLSGTENVVSCGSFTTDGSGNATVNLGYEPQWLMYKSSSTATNWAIIDSMRGFNVTSGTTLYADSATSEATSPYPVQPTATGFRAGPTPTSPLSFSQTYIYIAIRRGPMKVPTLGTTVFNALTRTGTDATAQVTGVGFAPDLVNVLKRQGTTRLFSDRLRGRSVSLLSTNTGAETTSVNAENDIVSFNMDGITLGPNWNIDVNSASQPYVNYFFRRAPGFFDEVCYTGTGDAQTLTHNLGAIPQLIIVKDRSRGLGWVVYAQPLGTSNWLALESTAASTAQAVFGTPTSTTFIVNAFGNVSFGGDFYVAYLFATCPGVSKVGGYTGTGTTQAINCGFTAGARFVLIKRTDSTGGWYVWDSARGIVAGNDPYLLLNSTAAEVTSTDYVDTSAAGFEISSTAPAEINAVGGSYIFLAVA